jgi:sulfur-carrier protein adenylyltransferase/sulfurtransferase
MTLSTRKDGRQMTSGTTQVCVPPRELLNESYSDHLRMPEIGFGGHRELLKAKVLLVGAGRLGSSSALALAAAEIGTLGIVDDDRVEPRNVPRQLIHARDRIGTWKVDSAARSIKAIAPDLRVVPHSIRLDSANAAGLLASYDVIVDGLDNLSSRYVLNDAAVALGIPVVSAAVFEFEGYLSVLSPPAGPCYRCLYPAPPPAELSPPCLVFAALPAVVGTLQAIEVVKLITGTGRPLIGRLLVYDSLQTTFTELTVTPNRQCPTCFGRGSKQDAAVAT